MAKLLSFPEGTSDLLEIFILCSHAPLGKIIRQFYKIASF